MFALHAGYSQLLEAAQAVSILVDGIPADHDAVIDSYVWHPKLMQPPDAMEEEIRATLNRASFSRPVRRMW